MNLHRASIGEVLIERNGSDISPVITGEFTTLDEYSHFKHGDGLAAQKYGGMLGELILTDALELLDSDEVFVSSSAYRIAPPASESLVAPFISSASSNLVAAESETKLRRFKISKRQLAADNYASMTFGERSKILQDDLVLPPHINFEDKDVIVLDDIRITGLREDGLRTILSRAGVRNAYFYYVLDTPDGHQVPQIEAVLNRQSVKTLEDAIALANSPNFIPNVRYCKFVLGQTIEDLEKFCTKIPPAVAETVVRYIECDGLRTVVKYLP